MGDKMREEFEAAYVSWLVSTGWDKDSALLTLEISRNGDYFSTSAQGAWWGWQASRAELVVELPSNLTEGDDYAEGWNHALVLASGSLRTAGVRVRP